jgi:hypothetical protein
MSRGCWGTVHHNDGAPFCIWLPLEHVRHEPSAASRMFAPVGPSCRAHFLARRCDEKDGLTTW